MVTNNDTQPSTVDQDRTRMLKDGAGDFGLPGLGCRMAQSS